MNLNFLLIALIQLISLAFSKKEVGSRTLRGLSTKMLVTCMCNPSNGKCATKSLLSTQASVLINSGKAVSGSCSSGSTKITACACPSGRCSTIRVAVKDLPGKIKTGARLGACPTPAPTPTPTSSPTSSPTPAPTPASSENDDADSSEDDDGDGDDDGDNDDGSDDEGDDQND